MEAASRHHVGALLPAGSGDGPQVLAGGGTSSVIQVQPRPVRESRHRNVGAPAFGDIGVTLSSSEPLEFVTAGSYLAFDQPDSGTDLNEGYAKVSFRRNYGYGRPP